MTRAKFVLLGLTLALGACSDDRIRSARMNQIIAMGQPPEYNEGYFHGCNSGRHAAGNPYEKLEKDVGRFEADALYRQGWNDGFSVCKSQYEAIGRALD